jgi:hypothetical protein
MMHSPIATRNIIDRFYRYVAENPGEAFERPMQELFIPMRADLIRMYPGYKAIPLARWAQEAEIRDFLRRMGRMPRQKFPFMVGEPSPKEIDFAPLLNNEYYRQVPVMFHRNPTPKRIKEYIAYQTKKPGVLGTAYPSHSIWPGVRLPYVAATAIHGGDALPVDTIVHEALHVTQPIEFDPAKYIGYNQAGRKAIEMSEDGAELALASLMPYIAKRETQMLANTGKMTPIGALQHALAWAHDWKLQKGYFRREGFPKSDFWKSPEGKRYIQWLNARFREAFQGDDLVHRIGQLALDKSKAKQLRRLIGATQNLAHRSGQLLVWNAMQHQGIPPGEITSDKMLKFVQDLPEGSPVHDFLMYGPAPGRDYWELVSDAQRTLYPPSSFYSMDNPPPSPKRLSEWTKKIEDDIIDLIGGY